jgi:hypothetical protein
VAIELSTFEYWLSLLTEKHGRSLSAAYTKEMFYRLTDRMTTEQFRFAAERIWEGDEYFPKLERFLEVSSDRVLAPEHQMFALPEGAPPAYDDMSPEEQVAWQSARESARRIVMSAAKTAPKSRVMGSMLGSYVSDRAGAVLTPSRWGAEVERRNGWLGDPVLRDEAIAWAEAHPNDVELVRDAAGRVRELRVLEF